MPHLDIHAVDDGYSVARHILVALDDAGADGMKSTELGALLHASGQTIGAWLRDLRTRGWVKKEHVTPGSYIVRWHLTEAGREYLNAPE